MTIFADPDENQVVAKCREAGLEIIISPQLEAMTGADFVISPLSVPFVPALLKEHIAAGAVLVQMKRGLDLSSSVVDRMPASLARMHAVGARNSQCSLLFIGVLTCDVNGEGKINNQPIQNFNGQSYWVVVSAMEKWMERGGVVTSLSRLNLLPDWLILKEKHLKEFHFVEPVHTVYDPTDPLYEVEPDDPLQELVLVKDWRKTLMSFPGIGKTKIEALLSAIAKEHSETGNDNAVTLGECIEWMTTWSLIRRVPGYGKGIYQNIRKWFGLEQPGTLISVAWDPNSNDKEE